MLVKSSNILKLAFHFFIFHAQEEGQIWMKVIIKKRMEKSHRDTPILKLYTI